MGWSGGSRVAEEIINRCGKFIPEEDRTEFYKNLIQILEDEDADTLDECCAECEFFAEAYSQLHPEED